MARKSKARRLLAVQGKLATPLKVERSQAHGREMAKLQQGSPTNTSRSKFDRMSGQGSAPRPVSLEGKGVIKKTVGINKRVASVPREHIEWQHDSEYVQSLVGAFLAKGGHIK